MKTCNLCHVAKPLTEFSRNCKSADGHVWRCRACTSRVSRSEYAADPRKRAKAVWYALLQRIGNANGKNPGYADVELRITEAEFIAWVVPRYVQFLQLHPDKHPSVDRIDELGHYELCNMQLIELGENSSRRLGNRNVHAPAGYGWCGKCRQYKLVSAFAKNRAAPLGRSSTCKTCEAPIKRKYKPDPAGTWAMRVWCQIQRRGLTFWERSEFIAWAVAAYNSWEATTVDVKPVLMLSTITAATSLRDLRLVSAVEYAFLRQANGQKVLMCYGCRDYSPADEFGDDIAWNSRRCRGCKIYESKKADRSV